MFALVNPQSRLLGSTAQVSMCDYRQYNSHNIYDTGCPSWTIWSCFLSTATPTPPQHPHNKHSTTSEEHQHRQNTLSPDMLIYCVRLQLLILLRADNFIYSWNSLSGNQLLDKENNNQHYSDNQLIV